MSEVLEQRGELIEPQPEPTEATDRSAGRAWRLLLAALVSVLALAGLASGYRAYSSAAQEPPGSPFSFAQSGVVTEILVKEGDWVEEGQLLAALDDTEAQAEVEEAMAALQQLVAEARQSEIAVAIPSPPSSGIAGDIIQTGPLNALPPVAGGSGSGGTIPVLPRAEANGQARTQPAPDSGKTSVEGARKKSSEARERLDAAQADLLTLENAIAAAEERALRAEKDAEVNQIRLDHAQREQDKMSRLLQQGAVSARDANNATAAVLTAQAALDTSRRTAAAARSDLDRLEGQRTAVQAALKQATTDYDQAEKLIASINERPPAEPAPPAQTQPQPQERTAAAAPSLPKPATVRLRGPIEDREQGLAPAKVDVDLEAKGEAEERIQEAKARVDEAQRKLQATRIYATRSGRVTKIFVKPGQQVQAGFAILAIRFQQKNSGRE